MNPFTKGKKVRAIRDTESRGGNADIGAGAVLEVSHTSDDSGHLFNAWHPNGIDVYALAKDDFEPVDATPAPLDPLKVKAGDTVTVVVKAENPEFRDFTIAGEVYNAMGTGLYVGGWPVREHPQVTLTDHQPAPEPEPEWTPGTTGTATVEGKVGVRGTWVRSLNGENYFATHHAETSTGNLAHSDNVTDFMPDATATCPHGQTAEDLCNAMPDKIELDAMWTAWKSLTPAEQRGWMEGGEGKVPTPAKVSIRTLMNGGAS